MEPIKVLKMKFEYLHICPLCYFEAETDFELENHIKQKHSFIVRKPEDESCDDVLLENHILQNHSFIVRKPKDEICDDFELKSDILQNNSFILRKPKEEIGGALEVKFLFRFHFCSKSFSFNFLSEFNLKVFNFLLTFLNNRHPMVCYDD